MAVVLFASPALLAGPHGRCRFRTVCGLWLVYSSLRKWNGVSCCILAGFVIQYDTILLGFWRF